MPKRRWNGPRQPRAKSVIPTASQTIELTVGPAVHGGHCIARIDPEQPGFFDDAGRVVFVRHALPGERVRARITERGKTWRADAIEVLGDASPDRVPSAWPQAGPDGVGGGELAHVSLDGQLRWKAAVIADQLHRLAKLERDVMVEPASSTSGYRTRISLVADANGRAGMRKHRSHDVVPLDAMPLATPELAAFAAEHDVWRRHWPPGAHLELVAPSLPSASPHRFVSRIVGDPDSECAPSGACTSPQRFVARIVGDPEGIETPDRLTTPKLLVNGEVVVGGPDRFVTETVPVTTGALAGRTFTYRVAADGFWQVHRDAPTTLVNAVLDAVGDVVGATVLDLYCGAGLFTLPLAEAVGPPGRVIGVEGSESACADARYNLHDYPWAEIHAATVDQFLTTELPQPNVVVLDPPRAGAGLQVTKRIAALHPARIVYVACDPAALARDTAALLAAGYKLTDLRAFDLFPLTHHVECVATFAPKTASE